MDEQDETFRSLKRIYATSIPIFSHGSLQMFGLIQCTTGQSILLVAPVNSEKIKCPLCGKMHLIPDSFIPLSVEEFVAQFQQSKF